MKRITSIQINNSTISLRPTKRRIQEKVEFSFDRVPKDIWLKIFKCIIPKHITKKIITDLYNCRLVCKKWANITKDCRVWNTIISNCGNYGQGLWADLFYTDSSLTTSFFPKTQLSPPSFFAQITMRGFEKENATLKLLAKWFRTKRWRLLFQTLSPILTLSSTQFNNGGSRNNYWNNHINFEKNMHIFLFKYGQDIHNTSYYIYKMQTFWSNNECGIKQYYGNCFYIQPKNIRDIRDPSHLVFHNDERGPYLEIRRWMQGSGLNCYLSDRVDPKHIWFGILCMQELWQGNNILQNYPEGQSEWIKCMNINPKMS